MRRLAAILAVTAAVAAGCSAGGSEQAEAPAGTVGPAEVEARLAELESRVSAGTDLEERVAALEDVALRLQSDLLRRTKQHATALRKLRKDFDTFVEDLEKAKEEEEKAAEAAGGDPLELLTKAVQDLRKQLAAASNVAGKAREEADDALTALESVQERLDALEAQTAG